MKQNLADLGKIFLIVCAISVMHYYTSYTSTEFHAFSALLYYIPIIFAAFRFGLKGGAWTGFLVSLIYAPYLIWHRAQLPAELVIKVLDVLLYNGIGWITGILVEAEHKQKRRYLHAVEQLKRANEELEQKIREKSELEEQVRRADKLAALGVLVSGVAHELRNPLGILKATIQVMERELGANAPVREFVSVFKEEVERMNNAIQEFLDFARPSAPQFAEVAVNEIVAEVVQFTRKYLEQRHIVIRSVLADGLPAIYADKKQIRQVFMNLVLNGAAAIKAAGGLEIYSEPLDHYIRVRFKDTGCGIPAENLTRIFDPFFTTKDAGTGLGLAVAHRIVDAHCGFIEVVSEAGQGAEFSVYLPINAERGRDA
mgnify:FL=1